MVRGFAKFEDGNDVGCFPRNWEVGAADGKVKQLG
jgi:hypothetical protein